MSAVQDEDVRTAEPRTPKGLLLGGLLLAFLIAGFFSGYASSAPDGLEKVAGDEGFLEAGKDSATTDSPLADYALSGIENERLAGGLAGIIGVLLAVAVGTLIFFVVTRLARRNARTGPGEV